mgnify:FL=1
MLGGRPVYYFWNKVRDAVNNNELFLADQIGCSCEAGLFYTSGGEICFTDGQRHMRICKGVAADRFPILVRVSESEYEIRVGGERYYLLDTMKWTCISI